MAPILAKPQPCSRKWHPFWPNPNLAPESGITFAKIDLAENRQFFPNSNLAPGSGNAFGPAATLLPEVQSRIDLADFQCLAMQTRCPWVRIRRQVILCTREFGSQTVGNSRARVEMVARPLVNVGERARNDRLDKKRLAVSCFRSVSKASTGGPLHTLTSEFGWDLVLVCGIWPIAIE